MSRGGPNNRGMVLRNNTCRLAAIRFAWREQGGGQLWPYVCVSWIDQRGKQRRTSISVERHGRRGAMERAIEFRKNAGFPVPSLQRAQVALARFLNHKASK